jgi:hypothetical protein
MFYSTEVAEPAWIANRPRTYLVVPPGPFEVNWNYDPTWSGPRRLIVTDAATARALGVR